MAEDKIDKTVISRTQAVLGKYVRKPPLTEKLLRKPPFRFLYDIFNVIIRETGCFQGLYSAEEENIENIKDREDKMKYLQKMIDVIKITTKQAISVRTSKIVAGQEPEKTNELLQLMGEVIEKELDWKTAVENVLNKSMSPTKPHRTLDKSKKEKETKSKEKSKELRKNSKTPMTKTISPNTKTVLPNTKEDQKSKSKTTITMENPKTDVRPKKEKPKKELKDTATKKTKSTVEKPKTTNSKPAVLDKTPSPKSTPTELTKEPTKSAIEVVGNNETLKEIIQKPLTPPKSMVPSTQPKAEDKAMPTETIIPNVASDQPGEDPKSMTSSDTHASSKDVVTESPQRSESRKSPTKRRTSSKNHRSASKARTEENESNQTSLNNIESLNTLNEEDRQPYASSLCAPMKELDLNKPKTDSIIKLDNVAPNINVKRETTFTRENSKDISGSFNENNTNNRPRTSLRPPSARPASARPGAPRRRDRNIEIILQPNDQIKMSGVNVKLETFGDFGDDGENLVIIESGNINESFGSVLNGQGVAMDNADGALEQQGHLVQQILETQKELVQKNSDVIENQDKDTDRSSTINTRQSSAHQMNNLRDVIQNLTKSVNPFGKLMDFIPEDIDAMQLELSLWRDSYTQTAHELKKEKSLTESVTEPMKNQLTQIEANIKEFQEIIDASRTKIQQNSEKILKMLTEQ